MTARCISLIDEYGKFFYKSFKNTSLALAENKKASGITYFVSCYLPSRWPLTWDLFICRSMTLQEQTAIHLQLFILMVSSLERALQRLLLKSGTWKVRYSVTWYFFFSFFCAFLFILLFYLNWFICWSAVQRCQIWWTCWSNNCHIFFRKWLLPCGRYLQNVQLIVR